MNTGTCLLAAASAAFLFAGCGGGGASGGSGLAAAPPSAVPASSSNRLSLAAQVGEKMFVDPNLSASKQLACNSCHDARFDYASSNDLSVQLGGLTLASGGLRAVPSLRYKDQTPPYSDVLDNPDGISVPGPGGGFTWDGRADTRSGQARFPLLDPTEMANADAAAVVRALQSAAYADLFRQAFGNGAFADVNTAFDNAGKALQAYQEEDSDFHPYSSKFDLYAGNKVGGALTAAEARGLQIFTDPSTGNCASCHYQGAGFAGSSALFTDFSYEAISVPRNPAIDANADPNFYDLGVCGPLRTDHLSPGASAPNAFCGLFKAPSLRNVARRKAFFHNGVMHSLEQVVRFYNTRDTWPEIWYPTAGGTPKAVADAGFPAYGLITTQYVGGTVQKFNDLPAPYRANIDAQMPLDGRPSHSAPPMSEQNVADLICFLNTLSDGYQPSATSPTSGPCVQ
jgi:cytochrome c peroxidase